MGRREDFTSDIEELDYGAPGYDEFVAACDIAIDKYRLAGLASKEIERLRLELHKAMSSQDESAMRRALAALRDAVKPSEAPEKPRDDASAHAHAAASRAAEDSRSSPTPARFGSTLPASQRPTLVGELEPDTAQASRFIGVLIHYDEGSEHRTSQTFDDSGKKRGRLAKIFHDGGHASELATLNASGAGIFFTINATDGKGRGASNIKRVRAVFIDADKNGAAVLEAVKAAGLEPHIIVESSPGKFHFYWIVTPDFPIEKFSAVQTALARNFGTDPNVKDLPRVMRLPGFYHMKNPAAPFMVRIVELREDLEPYALEQIVDTLGLKLEESPPPAAQEARVEDGRIPEFHRNTFLSRKAYSLKKDGVSVDAIEETLLALNKSACNPPLPENEVRKIARGKRKIEPDGVQVRADTEALLERAKADGGAVFEPDAVQTLRQLRAVDRAAFVRTRAELKALRIPMRDLDQALRSQAADGEEPNHLDVARAVRGEFGPENILYAQSALWLWQPTGIWRRSDERTVKQRVHEVLEAQFSATHPVTRHAVDSVFDILKTECFDEDRRFDAIGQDMINVQNGELHLVDGAWVLQPHVREHYRTTQLPIAYDPTATAPRFLQFLDEIFEGDPDAEDKKAVLLEALGYSLLPDCRFERFLILVGGGANGKSVLLAILAALIGADQVSAVQPSQFDNRFQRAHMRGKLANIVTEIAEGAEIADAELKAIVSGELITAEQKLRPPFEYRPFATCWFATNHMPHTRDFTDALFRRAIIVPFNRRFDGPGCDVSLKDKLCVELPGILNLALEGLARLIRQGRFTTTATSEAAKRDWRLQADQVAQFVEDHCEVAAGASTPSQVLYRAYATWASEAGIVRRVNRKNFTQRLERLGVQAGKGAGGVRMLYGIKLNNATFEDPETFHDLV